MQQTEEPKIKGLAFIEALRWYEATHGQERLTHAAHLLPMPLSVYATDPHAPTLGLRAGGWYPTDLVNAIFAELARGLTPDETLDLAANFARASIGNTLSGVYGTLMRLLVSPERVATNYQRIWRIYQTTGECKVTIHGPTSHELRISSWAGHTRFFCSMALFASRDVLELIGCKNVESKLLACVADGRDYCAYLHTWHR